MFSFSNKKSKEKAAPIKLVNSYFDVFRQGIMGGIGWAFGVTIGLILISFIFGIILRNVGGFPLIGSVVADIVENTQAELNRKNPLLQN